MVYDRWEGYCVGLFSQVFWVAYVIRSRAFGVGVSTLCHTIIWLIGIWRHALPRLWSVKRESVEREDKTPEGEPADV